MRWKVTVNPGVFKFVQLRFDKDRRQLQDVVERVVRTVSSSVVEGVVHYSFLRMGAQTACFAPN